MPGATACKKIMENMSRVVVGKKATLELLLVALVGEGHKRIAAYSQ